ncbi:MAG TPA: DUF998 domain-containing protein [Ktedonobacterales bacterium]|jgi:uncharacterized membrane protein (GlpM family)
MTQAVTTERLTGAARTLALLSLVGVILYIVIDVLLYVLRPELSLLHRAESDYGNGQWAWLMDANFLLRCALSLAAVGALWSVLPARGRNRLALGLLAVWAICSGVLAFFSDDEPGAAATPHGKLHLAAAAIAFLCCLIATFLLTGALARSTALAAMLSAAWGIAAAGFILLIVLGLHPNALGGLYERLFLGGELLWLAVAMGWLLRLRAPKSGA